MDNVVIRISAPLRCVSITLIIQPQDAYMSLEVFFLLCCSRLDRGGTLRFLYIILLNFAAYHFCCLEPLQSSENMNIELDILWSYNSKPCNGNVFDENCIYFMFHVLYLSTLKFCLILLWNSRHLFSQVNFFIKNKI